MWAALFGQNEKPKEPETLKTPKPPCGNSTDKVGEKGELCCQGNICNSGSCVKWKEDSNYNHCVKTEGLVDEYCVNTGGDEDRCNDTYDSLKCGKLSKCVCGPDDNGKGCNEKDGKYYVCQTRKPGLTLYRGEKHSGGNVEMTDSRNEMCENVKNDDVCALAQKSTKDMGFVCVDNENNCTPLKKGADNTCKGSDECCGDEMIMCAEKVSSKLEHCFERIPERNIDAHDLETLFSQNTSHTLKICADACGQRADCGGFVVDKGSPKKCLLKTFARKSWEAKARKNPLIPYLARGNQSNQGRTAYLKYPKCDVDNFAELN